MSEAKAELRRSYPSSKKMSRKAPCRTRFEEARFFQMLKNDAKSKIMLKHEMFPILTNEVGGSVAKRKEPRQGDATALWLDGSVFC